MTAFTTAVTAHDDPERRVFPSPRFIPAEDLARGLRLHAVEKRRVGWGAGRGEGPGIQTQVWLCGEEVTVASGDWTPTSS